MPELAELRFTADYINQVAEGEKFVACKKNPEHKGEPLQIPFDKFKLKAMSQGKELLLFILDAYSDQYIPVRMTMGMSGYFKMANSGSEPKHSHLIFYTDDGVSLCFVDVRRFGKWKQGVSWSENRGPDPTQDWHRFVSNVLANLNKPAFSRPIHEILMDQKYFNGIGNYLRAEILYRTECNPFMVAREAIQRHPEILELCRDIPMLAYAKGGGSIKDWVNPFQGAQEVYENFMICYGRKGMSYMNDRNGRRFWYDPKWDQVLRMLDLETEWDYYSGLPNPKAYETKNIYKIK